MKRPIGSILRITAALVLAAASAQLFACGGGGGAPSPTAQPTASTDERYSMAHLVRYWPEDADYDSCDYACAVEIPEFSRTFTAGANMNKAVDAYVENLETRVETVYMKAAQVKPPVSEVSCRVEFARGFTNVIFTEKHSYEAQPVYETYVLMLDERGDEVNLCDLFLDYHTEELIAAVISEKTNSDPKLIATPPETVLTCIDITHGASITEEGCTVYVHDGLLAPLDSGELAFNIPLEEVKPAAVASGALTVSQYRGIVDLLGFTSDAVVVRQEGVENGVLSEYAATSFMGELVLSSGFEAEAGRVEVGRDAFLSLYRSCFLSEFPGIDPSAHDIKETEKGFSVSAKKKEYRYNVDILSAQKEGSELILTGDLVFGDFGYAFTDFVSHADIVLVESPDSPFGFAVKTFTLHL